MAERTGLLGWPVGHSVSPAMHHAAFAALGLDWSYDLLPVPPDSLESEVTRLVSTAGYRGLNVTIPHKRAILNHPLVASRSPAVVALGAANTLVLQPDGSLYADNTDWRGFAADVAAHGIQVRGARCLVLGTGGSARAVVYALARGGAAAVTSVSRSPDGRQDTVGYTDLPALVPTADLIVNCTPVGMSPHVDHSLWPDDIPFPANVALYDLVYNPPVTRLMLQATQAGARAIGGLGMLVWQGALAFELWTGQSPPVEVMYQAAQAVLGME